jgi:hypothetical protein
MGGGRRNFRLFGYASRPLQHGILGRRSQMGDDRSREAAQQGHRMERLGSEFRGRRFSFGQLFPNPRAIDWDHADAGDGGHYVHWRPNDCVKTHTLNDSCQQPTLLDTTLMGGLPLFSACPLAGVPKPRIRRFLGSVN